MANQINLDKVSATASIVTVVAPENTVNGSILTVGELQDNFTYAAAAPAGADDADMVMVLAVPLSYEAEKDQNDFEIAANDLVRAYYPYKGFTVSVPVANITATAAVAAGNVVVPTATTKPEALAAAVGTETVVFEIEEVYTLNNVSMARLKCIKA
jgi:hypothetical protein